jgi:hypothetical protein
MSISQQIGAASMVKWGVCTSTTRPASPYQGQHIYETDTNLQYVWDGSAWVNNYASSASPTFTGTPTAPTATAGTNTTQLATTAFVTTAVSNISTGAVPNFLVYLSGGNSTAANGATIAYNSEVYDDTNNVLSGVFTVPTGQAGTYSFTCHANAYNIGTSGYMRGCIVTTGTYANTYFGSSYPASGTVDHYVEVSLVTKLAVGDTVKCLFYVPASGLYSAGLAYNSFSGARIA